MSQPGIETSVHSLLGNRGGESPRNGLWIPRGTWRFVQGGFDTQDPSWLDEIMQQLEAVKAGD